MGTGPLSSLEARSSPCGCLVWLLEFVLTPQNLVSHILGVTRWLALWT